MLPLPQDSLSENDPAASFQRILPELHAIPARRVRRVSSSVTHVVQVALGALPHLRTLRPRIDALPEFDATVCDRLDDYALGLLHANTVWLSTSRPSDPLPDLLKDCAALKHKLLRDAQALAEHGIINPRSLRNLEGYYGYEQVATDLHLLSTLLRENLASIDGRCGTTPEDLRYAENLVLCMRRLIGLRLCPPATARDEAGDLRARAFTITVEAYVELEHAADFLLRREPARRATALPPLVSGRPRKARGSSDKNILGGS